MKAILRLFAFGLLIGLFPLVAGAKLSGKSNLLGKFFVSNIKGTVTCVTDGRIMELKKGDTIPARGAIMQSAEGANATIVFSNGTGVYVDEKTHFEVRRFEQEFFAPNNNLRVEPSNSLTLINLSVGRVVLSTPQLLAGTTMLYETPHAMVNVRGDKVLIEVNSQQTLTHVALIAGNVSVIPRGADGNFLSIGKRLVTGQEAFVKYALEGNDGSGAAAAANSDKPEIQSVAEAQAGNTRTGYLGQNTNGSAAKPADGPVVTTESKARIVKIVGFAKIKLAGGSAETPVEAGTLVAKGATLSTDSASELYLETFPGAMATLRPSSTLEIEKLSVTKAGGTVRRQTSIIRLKAGTVISTIDPATKGINDYGVRTPKGLAQAEGTSFSVTVEDEGFSVTTTADTVQFTTPAGVSYKINAGNVTISPQGELPKPPVPLSQALTSDPGLAAVITTAVTTVANVVSGNLAGLSSESATNLITKVLATAAEALPNQAPDLTSQALAAVTAPSSSTSSSQATAIAAVTGAAVGGAPAQAVAIATAAAQSVPAQASVVAAAGAKAAPGVAPQIAAAVAQAVTPSSSSGPTASAIERASSIASAVTGVVPDQAAPVAVAVMQALSTAAPAASPESSAATGAAIAASVSSVAPSQAVPVASMMMRVLTQISPDASAQSLAQSAATLATSVTAVVPPQAQEVATAVMQSVLSNASNANSTPAASAQIAGLVTASVSQIAPDAGLAIAQGVAAASNLSVASVQESAQQSSSQAAQIGSQAGSIAQQAAQSAETGGQAGQTVAAAGTGSAATGGSGSSGGADSGSSNSTGAGSSSTTASSSGGTSSTGNSSTATGGSSESQSGGAGQSAGEAAAAAAGAAAGTDTGAAGVSDKATSIVVTQFDPGELVEAMDAITSATNSSGQVQPVAPDGAGAGSGSSSPGGGGEIEFVPVVPSKPPVDQVTSPAFISSGG